MTAIFKALGIEDSADSFAKNVITQWVKAKTDAPTAPDLDSEDKGHLEKLIPTPLPARVEE